MKIKMGVIKAYRDLIDRIKSMNFNKKITLFLTSTILATTITIMVAITVSTGMTITSKSSQMAMRQIESITNNLEVTLGDFNDIATLLISDERILNYTRADRAATEDYIALANGAIDALIYIKNVKSNIDYISLLKYNDNTIQYFGQQWTSIDLLAATKADFEKSTQTAYGNMKVSVAKKVFRKEGNALNIYQPVYDKYELNKQTGLICISVDEVTLRNFYEVNDAEMPFDIYLTDAGGKIISHGNQENIFVDSPYKEHLKGSGGSFQEDGRLVVYNYIEAWNWYVVGTIPKAYLLSDSYTNFALVLLLATVLCAAGMIISFRLSDSLYRPLKEIVQRMSIVSGGNLRTRMNKEYHGDDFKKMANGFNKMVEEIETLIDRVKMEQHQIERIELNALQSQIKPHFLYNTLDCIHWQALVDGNREVATMVKALATYYRLCLSKGRDVIPLSQEIAHINSYLIIQNMRYSDIIESDFQIGPSFESVPLPKMTLQPLVENSIYHGIKIKDGYKGRISIRTREDKGDVVVSMADNGTGMSREKIDEINCSISVYDESIGYGIRNVHKRIEILFGKGYGLFYSRNETGGITVDIRLPSEVSGEKGA